MPLMSPMVPTPQLSSTNFHQYIYSGSDSLVEFYADWCGACQQFQPKFEMLAAGLQQYNVQCARVNIDRDRDLANQYGITRSVLQITMHNGGSCGKFPGVVISWFLKIMGL